MVRELRAREDAACVAMYLTSEDVRALQAAGCASAPVLLDADAWLELPDGGWEGWLASLPSKRRREIRREARQFGDAGYTVRHLPLADCHERLGGLAAATMAKYGASATAEDWLRLLRMHVDGMGAAAQVSLCLRGGDPLGFCLYYVWGDTLYLRWAGFDYERLAGAAEYFNLAFYSHVALAAEIGVCRIHAGVKAPAAKALRGAELRPLWLVDLTEDSVLTRHREAVRAHNRTAYERLLADPCTRAAVTAADGWLEGCR